MSAYVASRAAIGKIPFNCANEEAAGLRAEVKASELPH
jgi:hypothetical protein